MLTKKKEKGLFVNCSPKDVLQLFSSFVFLGLSVYIALYFELPEGAPRHDLYMIAALTASYGLWRLWKGISGCRLQ